MSEITRIERASDLLKRHEITNIPVDIEEICRREGIDVSVVDMSRVEAEHGGDISGALLVTSDNRDIIVNEKDIFERQRFTIAHELGHFFLHYNPDTSPESMMISFRSARTQREYEADRFAAELLMPEKQIKEEYDKLARPYPNISTLAKKFNVSKAAMAYRLDTLGLRYFIL